MSTSPPAAAPAAFSCPVHRVTDGPGKYFFGYYDKHQWDPTDRYLLGLEVPFDDRPPGLHDRARILRIDTHAGNRAEVVAETGAWCWQQGCMLQWLPGASDEIIYNDRIGDRYVAVILNLVSGRRRVLPRPVYTVSPDGRTALSLNFSRLAHTRPGYGYNGLPDPWRTDERPDEDGVYRMDLATGEHELVVSIRDLANMSPDPDMEGTPHWVNHLLFNPRGDRFIFLHRWAAGRSFKTRMYTANVDGSDLHRVPVDRASHFIWRDSDHLVVWATTERFGSAYHQCRDRSDELESIGAGVLTKDGHCTFSPDGQWMLTDEYPSAQGDRPLILYRLADGQRFEHRESQIAAPIHRRAAL